MPRINYCRTRLLPFLLAVGLSGLYASCGPGDSQREQARTDGIDRIVQAHRDGESDVVVEASGIVERVLSDDLDFPRHQRFIIRIAPNHTLLVAHNIDLAPRVPVKAGSRVLFRGEYEWNEQGGVIHWTHHDPEDRRPGGWIELEGRRYY